MPLADFVEQANAVCTAYAQRFERLAQPTNDGELREFARQGRDLFAAELAELRALGSPGEQADVHGQMLEEWDAALAIIGPAADSGAPDAIERAFTEATPRFTAARKAAGDLGLDACASG